jgi:hypothetical protein
MSNQKSGWFSWFPSFFTKKKSNNGIVFMSGDEQNGKTGAQLEEEKKHRNREEQFKKNIKESNNELRGIFGVEERNKENQPISKSNSMNSIKSMKSKSMESG